MPAQTENGAFPKTIKGCSRLSQILEIIRQTMARARKGQASEQAKIGSREKTMEAMPRPKPLTPLMGKNVGVPEKDQETEVIGKGTWGGFFKNTPLKSNI